MVMPDIVEDDAGLSPKAEQVLAGARCVFLEQGFEGASVDEIARVAGTSKATLYSHFPDKRTLFEAVVTRECRRMAETAFESIDPEAPIEVALTRIGVGFSEFLVSPGAVAMFRMVIAESGRFPDIGENFYMVGPQRLRDRIAEVLRRGADRGELDIDDFDIAAEQFGDLCKSHLFLRRLLRIGDPPDAAALRANAQAAVRTFLARYAA